MANVTFQELPVAIALTGAEKLPIDQGGTTKSATVQQVGTYWLTAFPASIEYVIDGSGQAIQAGIKGTLEVPFDCTITRVTLLGNVAGTISVDIWKCAAAAYDPPTAPTSADSITGSETPALVADNIYQSTSLTGWTTSLSEGDILTYNVTGAASAVVRATLSLLVSRDSL